jgi:hypothetical protein
MSRPFPLAFKHTAKSAAPEDDAVFPQGIEVLSDPQHAIVDIVFVHGLTGDRRRTWTHPDTLTFWPKDLLSTHVPKARILTFGYDAYIIRRQGQVSTNRLADHSLDLLNALASSRQDKNHGLPIIFVAHSLGGLVCKDALRASRDSRERDLSNIYRLTVAIAFMGTPHSGSGLATRAKIPLQSLGLVKKTNVDLLGVLEKSSEILARVGDDFASLLRQRAEKESNPLSVVCFYESLPMSIIGTIVPTDSAIILGYNRISLHANHKDIVRFKNVADPNFRSAVDQIQRWMRDVEFGEALEPSPDDAASCLQSLSYLEMDKRHANIEEAAEDTCEWILSNPTYLRWTRSEDLEKTHGLLWIKGKPGSGKSTLMKKLFKAHRNIAKQSGSFCIGFFFNARGSDIEKSPIGFYRTLLSHLLRHSDNLLKMFTREYVAKKKVFKEKDISWGLSELQRFFHDSIALPELPPTEIFVDALDECSDEDVRKIVRSLSRSAALATARKLNVKMCWSSRHYPFISADKALELYLEDENGQDITQYLRLEMNRFQDLDFEIDLQHEIARKARGVFLWAVLVVQKVSKAIDQGRSVNHIKNLLENLPTELDALFVEILTSIDTDLHFETQSLFQWVLFSYRIMSLDEIQLVLAFGSDAPPSSIGEFIDSLHGWEKLSSPPTVRLTQLRKLVTEASGGLIECVHYGQGSSEAHGRFMLQVIHESVRDFFFEKGSRRLPRTKIEMPPADECHNRIFQTCRSYLQCREFRYCFNAGITRELFLDEPPKDIIVASKWATKSFTNYSVEYIYHHMGKAGMYSSTLDEEQKVKELDLFWRWATVGFSSLSPNDQKWDTEVIKSLFSPDIISRLISILNTTWFTVVGCASCSHYSLLRFREYEHESRLSPHGYGELLCAAAHHGDTDIIKEALRLGASVNYLSLSHHPAAYQAIAGGEISTIEVLKGNAADPKRKKNEYKPFQFTKRVSSHETEELSISSGTNLKSGTVEGDIIAPLYAAVCNDEWGAVRLLLERGADVNYRGVLCIRPDSSSPSGVL